MDKILLVEDDSSLSMGLEFTLKKEGFEVCVCSNISSAKQILNNNSFDLVLLDVMLPDGNGYGLCEYIRQVSDTPVIFLTACDEEVNIVLGLDIGGDDYITKPFRIKELISRIRAVLRRRTKENEHGLGLVNSIKSGEIVLYPLETKVEKAGVNIFLTPAEYKLLSILLQNPEKTLTRDIILEKLWDVEGEFVDDNTLSVYIRRLREKLEDKPSEPEYIVTVRGMGYKWNIKHKD